MEENKLKKALTAAGIWAVAVGAVISGSYYGWNYIFSETNFTGALIAMAIAILFYIPFAFMFAELATAIPSSAGPAAPKRHSAEEQASSQASAILLSLCSAHPVSVLPSAHMFTPCSR